jgi:hypothetical protein
MNTTIIVNYTTQINEYELVVILIILEQTKSMYHENHFTFRG